MTVQPATYGALLDAVRGVRWPVRRAVPGAMPGAHHSRQRGASAEFTEYRPYRQGDDTRRIDWKLLARSDRAYIRLATDRAVLPTLLVVDASSSMAFPAAARSKWSVARQLTVALAAIAHAAADPVGLAASGAQGLVRLAPRARRGVVGEIARTLDALTPGGAAPLAPALALARPGQRVALVSDLLGDAGDVAALGARHLAAGGELFVIHVVAREELDPPTRAVLATDPERPSVRRALVEQTRDEYLRAFGEWRDQTARAWRAAGAVYTMVATDDPIERAVRRIVQPARA